MKNLSKSVTAAVVVLAAIFSFNIASAKVIDTQIVVGKGDVAHFQVYSHALTQSAIDSITSRMVAELDVDQEALAKQVKVDTDLSSAGS